MTDFKVGEKVIVDNIDGAVITKIRDIPLANPVIVGQETNTDLKEKIYTVKYDSLSDKRGIEEDFIEEKRLTKKK